MRNFPHRRNWVAFPDGSSNDSDDYEKRFPTCTLPNDDRIVCRYSCLDLWKSYGIVEGEMPFTYEVVTQGMNSTMFELELLLLEERILTSVASELGLIDCNITAQGGSSTVRPDSLVSSLASYDQDRGNINSGADCIVESASERTEKCVPIRGFMTVGCDRRRQTDCEELIAELITRKMEEGGLTNDRIVRVAWVGPKFESREAPPPPDSIVSLETGEEKKSIVGMSLIIAAAVACTLALLAFLAKYRQEKKQNTSCRAKWRRDERKRPGTRRKRRRN